MFKKATEDDELFDVILVMFTKGRRCLQNTVGLFTRKHVIHIYGLHAYTLKKNILELIIMKINQDKAYCLALSAKWMLLLSLCITLNTHFFAHSQKPKKINSLPPQGKSQVSISHKKKNLIFTYIICVYAYQAGTTFKIFFFTYFSVSKLPSAHNI